MTDTTETMKTETTAEQVTEAKSDATATDEANAASAAGGDQGEKPAENGTEESATDNAEAPPKLFVGRLPLGTKDTQLKELFGTYGEVTHCDIVGKYGFVHMKNKEEADEAMKKLNNHPFNGSNITVQMSTSTAKKTKKKNQNRKNFDNKKPNTNNANASTNSNQATQNRRPNMKNGFQQKNKNANGGNNNSNNSNTKSNLNNANNRNKNGNSNHNNNLGHNNRQNGMMNNKMRGRKFPTHRMQPMMPQLAPMNQGYYPNNQPPMNPQPYYQQPMPQHQMPPVGGPRDMYPGYNSRPMDNGQYYRSNGQSPQPMYGGSMPPQVSPQPSYYPPQQPYSNRAPVGGMGKMNPMPTHQQPQPSMYGSPIGMGPMNANPAPMNTGYGQMNSGYGTSPMMGSNGVNKYVGGYTNY